MRARMTALCLALLAACGGSEAARPASGAGFHAAAPETRVDDIDRDTARIRAATAAFRSLDAAVAAGYARSVRSCIAHPPHGAMGFHHGNAGLMDDRIELERPEILVYSRASTGEYVLNGVEYIVPYTSLSRDATPPRVMGQALKRSDQLQLWYLHVWIYRENPNGLFADWNPRVEC
ncbi:MAG TPA: hypothetical protein VF006_18465 [Longimicrobium sp.]